MRNRTNGLSLQLERQQNTFSNQFIARQTSTEQETSLKLQC